MKIALAGEARPCLPSRDDMSLSASRFRQAAYGHPRVGARLLRHGLNCEDSELSVLVANFSYLFVLRRAIRRLRFFDAVVSAHGDPSIGSGGISVNYRWWTASKKLAARRFQCGLSFWRKLFHVRLRIGNLDRCDGVNSLALGVQHLDRESAHGYACD
jgi:hypothetical protein